MTQVFGIDGCAVSRARAHNLSFIEALELMPGNRILVSKRNMIIPHIEENLDRGGFDLSRLIPVSCPCCGMPTRVQVSGDWFQNEEHWLLWEELREFVHIAPPAEPKDTPAAAGNLFAGKTIVVTGKVEPYTRGEMNSFIASLGAVAGSSVTGKTDYLVCGEKAGSKLDKARSLNIPVLTPDEFLALAQAS